MQTGQNPTDPLTQLNGHRAFGAMAGFNPFAQMGLNPNDPNMVRIIVFYSECSIFIPFGASQMQSMLDSPGFLQQMSQMMSDPALLDQILASNPQFAALGPQAREIFNNEGFRRMM